jgi:hypothetical protein
MSSNSHKISKIPQPQLAMVYHKPLVQMLQRCVAELKSETRGEYPLAAAQKLLIEIEASTPGK